MASRQKETIEDLAQGFVCGVTVDEKKIVRQVGQRWSGKFDEIDVKYEFREAAIAAQEYKDQGKELTNVEGFLVTVMNRGLHRRWQEELSHDKIAGTIAFDEIGEDVGCDNLQVVFNEVYTQTLEREFKAAILRLPENTRSASWLHLIEGLSVSEIAEVLEIEQAALRKRLQRGKARLKNDAKLREFLEFT